jgi:hypothetical protein
MKRNMNIEAMALIVAFVLAGSGANAQLGPATSAGVNAEASAAAQRVMIDALRRGATRAGCNTLLPGWSRLAATVRFPKSYGGYPQWVNTAELLPVGDDLASFVKTGTAKGAFVRPAIRVDDSTVQMTMCAPAGFAYWVVVDSGTARVPVGRIAFSAAGTTYRQVFVAPPLGGSSGTSSNAQQSGRGNQTPTTDSGWKPPTSDNSWKPPTSDNSWKPPSH